MPTQSAKSKMSLENRLVTAKGEGGGGRMEKKARVSRCKFIYIYRERELNGKTTRSYCIAQGTIFNIL